MDNGNEMAAAEVPPVREAEFQELNAQKVRGTAYDAKFFSVGKAN